MQARRHLMRQMQPDDLVIVMNGQSSALLRKRHKTINPLSNSVLLAIDVKIIVKNIGYQAILDA